MNNFLIIDGHNLLFQMFFGMPNKIYNHEGKNINGVIGFIGALNKLISMINPSHIVVLFDSEHSANRQDLLPEYKQNRIDYSEVEELDNPFSQLEYIYKALSFMNIKYCEVKGYETDDVIASYVLKYKDFFKIYVSSFDSDFFQLIDDNVTIVRYRGDNTVFCECQYLIDKYNITPNFYADFKSLIGDTADNIKGINGIGIKTAAKLINEFGDVNNIIENSSKITPIRIKNLICDSFDLIRLNYSLIKLKMEDNLPFLIDDLYFQKSNFKTNEILINTKIK